MVVVYEWTHVLVLAVALAVFVLSLLPIRSIIDSINLSSGQKVYWVIVVVLFPVLGAIAWLAFARRKA
jgi:hypothetical protein